MSRPLLDPVWPLSVRGLNRGQIDLCAFGSVCEKQKGRGEVLGLNKVLGEVSSANISLRR